MSRLTEIRDRLTQLEQDKERYTNMIKEIKQGKLLQMVGEYYRQQIDDTLVIFYVRSCDIANNALCITAITICGEKYALYDCDVPLSDDGTGLIAPKAVEKVISNGSKLCFPTEPTLSSAEEFMSLLSDIIQKGSTEILY